MIEFSVASISRAVSADWVCLASAIVERWLRTGVASDGSVRDVGVLERVGVRRRWWLANARPVAARE